MKTKTETSDKITVSRVAMRRFIMGTQGLWPGRRWRGKTGAAQAIHEIGAVQIDPLVVVARNHDLKLHSRVADYQPTHLNALLYEDHRFFDYGGLLQVYPIEELPYWQLHMKRHIPESGWQEFVQANQVALDTVRREVRARGPLGHRDVDATSRVESYRARKDTGLAMYYLWRIGEFMTAKRRNFDRLYDFAENVAPSEYLKPAPEADAETYFFLKSLSTNGLSRFTEWRNTFAFYIRRTVTPDEMTKRIADYLASGEVTSVRVEGKKDPHYLLTSHLPLLETVESGNIPEAWKPLDTTTDTEVNFLAPLDPVSARGRAAVLFDFEYKWEIYTPIEKRKWGYYVLPILYKDTLVARMDVKLDRPSKTLLIKGFWLENPDLGKDAAFAEALTRGLIRFTRFHEVSRLDANTIRPVGLRAAKLFKGSGITLVKE